MRLEPRPKQSLIKPSESYHSPKVLARRKTSRMDKPNIIEVIGQYVELHKMGREYVGLCPFHAERTPSFSVNLEKQLFHCFGCGEGGSVFDFVMKMENCDFKTAVKNLGLQTYRPSPQGVTRRKEAKRIAWWARDISNKLRDALLEIGDQIRVCSLARKEPGADQQLISQHEAGLIRQWATLCDLDDDLTDPKAAIELWEQRENINRLVESLA